MSVEGIPTPQGQPPTQPADCSNPSERQERFWDLKASHWVEVFLTIVLIGVGGTQALIYWRQAGIMDKQAEIAAKQNEITIESSRAIVSAKELRIEKKDIPIPNKPGQFEAFWYFSPVIENGGNTTTKKLRISAQAAIDPSRPDVEVKLPLGMGFGQKQTVDVAHLRDAGPPDPEMFLIEAEKLEEQGKPSSLIRTILGPHISQALAGFGIPVEETKRRLQEGGRWFVVGAIHYEDRFSKSTTRLLKYCFNVGFEVTASGELNPTYGPCPHWNCADEECGSDKAAYEAETADWQTPVLLSIPPSPPPYPPPPK